jgi:hypothetical protein
LDWHIRVFHPVYFDEQLKQQQQHLKEPAGVALELPVSAAELLSGATVIAVQVE